MYLLALYNFISSLNCRTNIAKNGKAKKYSRRNVIHENDNRQ